MRNPLQFGGFTMTRLLVVPHLSHEESGRPYCNCTDAAEKTRWHVLWLVTRPDEPLSATAAAKLVGFTPARGRAILKRYNAHGRDTLADGRRENGSSPKLTPCGAGTRTGTSSCGARTRAGWASSRWPGGCGRSRGRGRRA